MQIVAEYQLIKEEMNHKLIENETIIKYKSIIQIKKNIFSSEIFKKNLKI